MPDIIGTLREKFTNLTPEQRERFTCAVSEQELDAALAEANITLTAEEKDNILKHIISAKPHELTDEEAEQAAGGAGFKKCPHGHYEATGFANVFGASKDCNVNICINFKRSKPREMICSHNDDLFDYTKTYTMYTYRERCNFFNREIERTDPSSKLQTNW